MNNTHNSLCNLTRSSTFKDLSFSKLSQSFMIYEYFENEGRFLEDI